MKTFNFKLAVSFLAAFFCLLSFAGRAQISLPYTINNANNCTLVVEWKIYKQQGGCNTVCSSGSQTLVPFQIITLPNMSCTSACKIEIRFDGSLGNPWLTCTGTLASQQVNTSCGQNLTQYVGSSSAYFVP